METSNGHLFSQEPHWIHSPAYVQAARNARELSPVCLPGLLPGSKISSLTPHQYALGRAHSDCSTYSVSEIRRFGNTSSVSESYSPRPKGAYPPTGGFWDDFLSRPKRHNFRNTHYLTEDCSQYACTQNTSISFLLLQTCLHAAQMRLSRMHFRGGKVLARVHSHDDRFVYKHTVCNPKRYGAACEGIMFDENDRFLTELCKLRARTRSKRFYRERCPSKCNAAK